MIVLSRPDGWDSFCRVSGPSSLRYQSESWKIWTVRCLLSRDDKRFWTVHCWFLCCLFSVFFRRCCTTGSAERAEVHDATPALDRSIDQFVAGFQDCWEEEAAGWRALRSSVVWSPGWCFFHKIRVFFWGWEKEFSSSSSSTSLEVCEI